MHTILYTTTLNCPSFVPNYVTAVVTLILALICQQNVILMLPDIINFNIPGVINKNDNSNGFSNPQLRPPW